MHSSENEWAHTSCFPSIIARCSSRHSHRSDLLALCWRQILTWAWWLFISKVISRLVTAFSKAKKLCKIPIGMQTVFWLAYLGLLCFAHRSRHECGHSIKHSIRHNLDAVYNPWQEGIWGTKLKSVNLVLTGHLRIYCTSLPIGERAPPWVNLQTSWLQH